MQQSAVKWGRIMLQKTTHLGNCCGRQGWKADTTINHSRRDRRIRMSADGVGSRGTAVITQQSTIVVIILILLC